MTLVRHYDAATAPQGMLRHVLPVFGYPALVWRNRYMVQNFLRRDLLARVHGSYLGVYWILLQPMLQFALYFLVFGILFGAGPDPGYAIYLFTGVVVFASLTEAASMCCQVVVDNGNLVKKVAFPSEVLPLVPCLSSVVVYLVGAVVALGAGLAFGVLQPGLSLLAWPLVLLVQFVLTLGLGLLLANGYVFVRDLSQVWRIVVMAWQFLSPVFWTPQLLQDRLAPHAPWAVGVLEYGNPMYALIMAHRLALGGTDASLGDLWSQLGIAAAWAVGLLLLGYSAFVSSKHKYADLI